MAVRETMSADMFLHGETEMSSRVVKAEYAIVTLGSVPHNIKLFLGDNKTDSMNMLRTLITALNNSLEELKAN
jgi:hypothetical protein